MIVTKRFFNGRTQMEVADEIGISQAQVSRLEKSAIQHIKSGINKNEKIFFNWWKDELKISFFAL